MSLIRLLLVCSLLSVPSALFWSTATAAHTQDKPATKAEDPAKRKLQKVRDLLVSMNQRAIARGSIDASLEALKQGGAPADYCDKFKERFDVDELIEASVEIYAKHLDEEEIDALASFYKTESGKKISAAMPAITVEAIKMGQEYGKRVAQEIGSGK